MVLPHDNVKAMANKWTNVKKSADRTKKATKQPATVNIVAKGW
jgi:hypothetical protein